MQVWGSQTADGPGGGGAVMESGSGGSGDDPNVGSSVEQSSHFSFFLGG